MKKYITMLALVALVGLTASAQTNTVVNTNAITAPTVTLVDTNTDKGMPMELTLGGGGVTSPKTGETSFGVDVSLSVQPFKLPIWFGVAQGFAWEPSLTGSTYSDSTWSFDLIKDKLNLNAGWSAGAMYDRSTVGWRSGPELQLEYYTSGNAFIYVGINYDLITKDSNGWKTGGSNSGLRYGFGVGIAW